MSRIIIYILITAIIALVGILFLVSAKSVLIEKEKDGEIRHLRSLVGEQQKDYENLNLRFDLLQEERDILNEKVKESTRSAFIRNYFVSKNSILVRYADDIYRAGTDYGLDPKLLPVISTIESGACRRYILSTNNCLGWGSGRLSFTSIPEGFRVVARGIAKNKAYANYRKNPTLYNFARAYNAPYADDYFRKLSAEWNKISSFEGR